MIKQLRQAVRAPSSGQQQEQQQKALEQQMATAAKDCQDRLHAAQEEFEKQCLALTRQHEDLQSNLSQRLEEKVLENKQKEAAYDTLVGKMQALQQDLNTVQRQRDDIQQQVQQQTEQLNSSNNTIFTAAAQAPTDDLEAKLSSLQALVTQYEKEKAALSASLASSQYENEQLKLHVAACQSSVQDSTTSQQPQNSIAVLEASIQALEKDKKVVSESLAACQMEKNELIRQFSVVQAAENSATQALGELKVQNQK